MNFFFVVSRIFIDHFSLFFDLFRFHFYFQLGVNWSLRADGMGREGDAPDAGDPVVVEVDPNRWFRDVERYLGQPCVRPVEPVRRRELISPSSGRTQN